MDALMTENNNPPAIESGDRLLLPREVAERLRCSLRTIWRLRAKGVLPAVKIAGTDATRFRLSDVRKILELGGQTGGCR